jgi:hypothetical protein
MGPAETYPLRVDPVPSAALSNDGHLVTVEELADL